MLKSHPPSRDRRNLSAPSQPCAALCRLITLRAVFDPSSWQPVARFLSLIAVVLLSVPQSGRCALEELASWSLDEAAAPYADQSGRASDLTLDVNTAAPIAGGGVLDGAAQLNWQANPGVSTRLCNYHSSLQRDSFGFSFWLRPISINPGDNLIGKEMAATTSGDAWSRLSWQLHVGSDDGNGMAPLELIVRGSDRNYGDFFGSVWSAGKVPLYYSNAPEWIHLAGGYDVTTGQLRLYINGVEAVAGGTPGANNSDGGALVAGSMMNAGVYIAFAANAEIDDLQIFSEPPMANAVASIIADPACSVASPVVIPYDGHLTAHWKLNETGSVFNDWSGNQNNLNTDGATASSQQSAGVDAFARFFNWNVNPGISTRMYASGSAFQTDSFGFSFWVGPEHVGEWNSILAKELAPVSGPDYTRMAWQILVAGDNGSGSAPLEFVVRGSDRGVGDYFGSVQSDAVIPLQTSSPNWVHVAGGYDAASGLVQLIVNGQKYTMQGTPGADHSDGSYLSVGSVRNGNDFVAYGATADMDEIQLYSAPLGIFEADYLMDHPGAQAPAGLNTQVSSGGPGDDVTLTFNSIPGVEYVVEGLISGTYVTLKQLRAVTSPVTVTLDPVGAVWPPTDVRVAVLRDFPDDGSAGYAPAQIDPFINPSAYVPQFHFAWPYAGTAMGDPCGFYKYNGEYHLYTWNHASSNDLVDWTTIGWPLQGSLPPDTGLWTGTVVVDVNNDSGFGSTQNPPHLMFYTMHHSTTGKESIGMAYSTDGGTNFYPYSNSDPVVETADIIFRDPDVFYDVQLGRWVMLVARSDQRDIQFWFSNDLINWNHYSTFGPVGSRADYWECPSLFQVPVQGSSEKKWVLSIAAGLNKMQYFVGDFDGTDFTMDAECEAYVRHGVGLEGAVFADFEWTSWTGSGWTVEGQAFGTRPAVDSALSFLGWDLADSKVYGDIEKDSKLTSPAFTVTKNCINFLIAGGDFPGTVCINLIVGGNVVRTATGQNSDVLRWNGWDVAEFLGQQAHIEIVDDSDQNWGHIYIDHIMFSDVLMNMNREQANWVEGGEDFYSAKPVRDFDGDETEVNWMGWICNWDYEFDRPEPNNWGKGAESLIRTLELVDTSRGYQLLQTPMRAMQKLRGNVVNGSPRIVSGTQPISEFQPATNTYELEATFDLSGDADEFGLKLCVGTSQQVVVGYDVATSQLYLDRSASGYVSWSSLFPKVVSVPLQPDGDTLNLRVFVDQASVEIFAEDGHCVLTSQIYPDTSGTGVEVFSNGGDTTLRSLRAWPLSSIW